VSRGAEKTRGGRTIACEEGLRNMDAAEIQGHLEEIARSDDVSASTRVRALEVLLRLAKTASPEDVEWGRIVQRFGDGHE
jgi:hypothetical protein